MDGGEEEDSIRKHAKQLFSEPPKPPNSIPLILAEATLEANEGVPHAEIVSNILYQILMQGLTYIFGQPPYDWTQLNSERLTLVQRYMASMGVQLELTGKRGMFCTVFAPIKPEQYPPGMTNYVFPLCRMDQLIPELRNK